MQKTMTTKIATKWINALRSGDYNQTKHCLQDQNGFCCLGVLCDITLKKPKLNEEGFLLGAGLVDQNLIFDKVCNDHLRLDESTNVDLASLNDDGEVLVEFKFEEQLESFSFDEIADILQAVLILKVLE